MTSKCLKVIFELVLSHFRVTLATFELLLDHFGVDASRYFLGWGGGFQDRKPTTNLSVATPAEPPSEKIHFQFVLILDGEKLLEMCQ